MSTRNQTIGNGPEVHTRAFNGGGFPGEGLGQYPGLGGAPFADFPQGGGLPVPYEGGAGGGSGGGLSGLFGGGAAGGGTGGGAGGLLNGLNFNQIKGFVDRMGGIEGIMGTMGKVQKFVSTFQQMAPMLKVMFNSFGGGKVKSTDDDEFVNLPRRRKRRRGTRGRKPRGGSRRRR